MLAKLHTFALLGIDAVTVEVEVDAATDLPKIVLVGPPELAIRESIQSGMVEVEPVPPPLAEIEGRLNQYDLDFADVRG
jgi:hypothetical protein